MTIHCIGRRLKFIYIEHGSVIQSEVVFGFNHVIVLWFVPSYESDSAISAHTNGFDEVQMHLYDHPLHPKVLKHFISI